MTSTSFALNELVGCGLMSGLLVRSLCLPALMKSGDQESHQECELFAQSDWRVFLVFRGNLCRSSRLVALAKLELELLSNAP